MYGVIRIQKPTHAQTGVLLLHLTCKFTYLSSVTIDPDTESVLAHTAATVAQQKYTNLLEVHDNAILLLSKYI
jgi:hypothetical protein